MTPKKLPTSLPPTPKKKAEWLQPKMEKLGNYLETTWLIRWLEDLTEKHFQQSPRNRGARYLYSTTKLLEQGDIKRIEERRKRGVHKKAEVTIEALATHLFFYDANLDARVARIQEIEQLKEVPFPNLDETLPLGTDIFPPSIVTEGQTGRHHLALICLIKGAPSSIQTLINKDTTFEPKQVLAAINYRNTVYTKVGHSRKEDPDIVEAIRLVAAHTHWEGSEQEQEEIDRKLASAPGIQRAALLQSLPYQFNLLDAAKKWRQYCNPKEVHLLFDSTLELNQPHNTQATVTLLKNAITHAEWLCSRDNTITQMEVSVTEIKNELVELLNHPHVTPEVIDELIPTLPQDDAHKIELQKEAYAAKVRKAYHAGIARLKQQRSR